MKILAIRGRNLASLSGDFEVNLEVAPLGDVGLFAISGPTGAGKTTLLDAMCLALFDRTPRLSAVSNRSAKVGDPDAHEDLWTPAHDVKSLLRKGTGSGFAEVDFLGRDAQRYRARWSVWRARERPNGKLQNQGMELRAMDALDTCIGRTKEDVLAAIEQRLGLSFEQFRRSALLAQGDFAAFLRADEKERAELLEQMTGTSIYGDLSVRAHERSKQEARALDELEKRHREIVVMTEEERAAVTERIANHELHAKALQQQFVDAENAQRYHQTLALLSSQIAEASRSLDVALASDAEAAPRREKVSRVEAALALAPQLARRDETAGLLVAAEREKAQFEASCQQVSAQVATAQQLHRDAEAHLSAVKDDIEKSAPDVARATTLDAELSASAKNLSEAERETDVAQRKAMAAADDARSKSVALAEVSKEHEAAERKRADSAYLTRLAKDWLAVRRLLVDYRNQRKVMERAALPNAQQFAQKATQAQADAESKLAAADAERKTAATALALAEQEAAQFDVPALRTQKDRLMSEGEVIGDASRVVADVAAALRELQGSTESAAQAEEQATALLRSAISIEQECARIDEAIADAEEKLTHARAAQDLAAHRVQLRPEHPCPLCGSPEHPWAEGSPVATGSIIELQQERVTELSKMRRQQETQSATQRNNHRVFTEKAASERERAAQADGRLMQLDTRWGQILAQLGAESGLPDSARDASAAAAVEATRQSRVALVNELRVKEKAADAASARVTSSRAAFDQARSRAEGLHQQAMERKSEATAAAESLRRATEDVESARSTQRGIVREASEYFDTPEWDGWEQQLADDVDAFGKACGDKAAAFDELLKHVTTLAERLHALEPESKLAANMATELAAIASAKMAHAKTLLQTHEERRTQRSRLLHGQPTELFRKAQQDALHAAEQNLQRFRAEHESQQKALSAAEARLAAAAQLHEERKSELARAEQVLAAALEASSLSVESAREAISLGASWVASEQAALDALRQAVERCRAVLAEREARRQEHTSGATPALAADEVQGVINQTGALLEETKQAISIERVRLHDDDKERERGVQMAERIREQRARAELWGALSGLIGSADGKKFRVFAQSLTFDTLITLANVHLTDLARRYQLMRVPRTDLDLQVIDREMADEVRAVSSLSGGETFLISLALALGLSSLGSRDTRVETLFIDEGFGTLDPEALDVALSALDALQDAGRKVGLISHVPGLAERLGAQVRVQPRGAGRSVVLVEG